ncbi:MAG: class I SAM-dependent methyltransferase [Alphaproteobacteria bacterium]|nr:class I SAM-dependent methyltransferase [Alphaproteobacteria bacterium]
MDVQTRHDMIVPPTMDEGARQEFTYSLRYFLYKDLIPGARSVYEADVLPQIKRASGLPKNRHDIAPVMERNPYWQMYSSIRRVTQELMWDTFGEKIEKRLPQLIEKAKKYRKSNKRLGSIMLDPNLEIPRYHTATDIHIQPGGYHTELCDDDVYAGALYDDVIWMFFMHSAGGLNDAPGRSIIQFVNKTWPNLKPKRILDMGCTIGHSTLPYVDAFPKAEIHAIDVGAPCIRYAHARAEALGKKVHFSQQNAEKTNFPDGHFDLIVSHIMVHETSNKAMPRILKECHRLLAPGGVMVHQDIAPKAFQGGVYGEFNVDWSTHYNAEPFIGRLVDLDHTKLCVEAGFSPKKVKELDIPGLRDEAKQEVIGPMQHIFGAQK